MCFETQPQVLWQVSIATITITEYGIVGKDSRFKLKLIVLRNGVIESK